MSRVSDPVESTMFSSSESVSSHLEFLDFTSELSKISDI